MKCKVIDFVKWKRKALGMVYRGNGIWSRELTQYEARLVDQRKKLPDDYTIIKLLRKKGR